MINSGVCLLRSSGASVTRFLNLVALALPLHLHQIGAAQAGECARDVNDLDAAKNYAECLDNELSALRKLITDRFTEVLTENTQLKAELAKKIDVGEVNVSGSLSVGTHFVQNGIGVDTFHSDYNNNAAVLFEWKPGIAINSNQPGINVANPPILSVQFDCIDPHTAGAGNLNALAHSATVTASPFSKTGEVAYSGSVTWDNNQKLFRITKVPWITCVVTARHWPG